MAGKCPFGYDSDKPNVASSKAFNPFLLEGGIPLMNLAGEVYPAEVFKCSANKVMTTSSLTPQQYEAIYKDIYA